MQWQGFWDLWIRPVPNVVDDADFLPKECDEQNDRGYKGTIEKNGSLLERPEAIVSIRSVLFVK